MMPSASPRSDLPPAAQRGQLGQAGSPVAIVRLTVAEVFAVGGCGEGLDVFPVHGARLVPALQLERLLLRQGNANGDRHGGASIGISHKSSLCEPAPSALVVV